MTPSHDRTGDADRPGASPGRPAWPRPRRSTARSWPSRPIMPVRSSAGRSGRPGRLPTGDRPDRPAVALNGSRPPVSQQPGRVLLRAGQWDRAIASLAARSAEPTWRLTATWATPSRLRAGATRRSPLTAAPSARPHAAVQRNLGVVLHEAALGPRIAYRRAIALNLAWPRRPTTWVHARVRVGSTTRSPPSSRCHRAQARLCRGPRTTWASALADAGPASTRRSPPCTARIELRPR